MTWELFVPALDVVIWPVTVLVLAFGFRRHLDGLLGRLDSLRVGKVELKLGERLEEAKEKSDRAQLPPAAISKAKVVDDSTATAVAERLADVSPRAAILESWAHLESGLRRAQEATGLTPQRHVSALALDLWVEGVATEAAFGAIQDLRMIRNEAAHNPRFKATAAEAIEYADTIDRIISALRRPAE